MISHTSRVLPILFVLSATGCGEKGPPPGAQLGTPSPVHGKITFADGNTLNGGVVTFHPIDPEAGYGKLRYEGSGLVNAKGEYTAGRNGDNKGLVPGEYVVTVEPRDLGELPGSNSESIPKELREKKTSNLKVTIAETDNKIDLTLR